MAVHGPDFRPVNARQRHQLEVDRHEIFADNMQLRFRQQIMDVGNPAGDGVFNRDHGQIRFALRERIERVFKRGAGQGLHAGKHVAASHVGICAKLALEGDTVGGCGHQICPL